MDELPNDSFGNEPETERASPSKPLSRQDPVALGGISFSDYSPLKGKSNPFAAFSTPPPSKLVTAPANQPCNDGDLTVSEEEQEPIQPDSKEKLAQEEHEQQDYEGTATINVVTKNNAIESDPEEDDTEKLECFEDSEVNFGGSRNRSLPINFSDEETATESSFEESESSSALEPEPRSDSEVSLIIYLPSDSDDGTYPLTETFRFTPLINDSDASSVEIMNDSLQRSIPPPKSPVREVSRAAAIPGAGNSLAALDASIEDLTRTLLRRQTPLKRERSPSPPGPCPSTRIPISGRQTQAHESQSQQGQFRAQQQQYVHNLSNDPSKQHPQDINNDQSRATDDMKAASASTHTSLAPSAVPSGIISKDLKGHNGRIQTGYVYDDRMLLHFDPIDSDHPEQPARIAAIYEKLRVHGLLGMARNIPLTIEPLDLHADLKLIHEPEYCASIDRTSIFTDTESFRATSAQYNSVYMGPNTALSAAIAAACTIDLCHSIAKGHVENGFAIVRPPGHHAEHDEAMGFCIYNNVAVAAASLRHRGLAKRVLILDWDVHHGNGTQNAFAQEPDVLYISLHRYDFGRFYPHFEIADHSYVGEGPGLGRSVNVAWNGPGFGDADYLYAFSRLIMPISREFNPDFVIVSAGFDAADGDPIGQCQLTPYGYSTMLQELCTLAGGKVALVLEGGYNVDVISECYMECVRVLLREPPLKPPAGTPLTASPRAIAAIENCVLSQAPHWRSLFPKPPQISASPAAAASKVSLSNIIDAFWKDECGRNFQLNPLSGLFSGSSLDFSKKYSSRVLASPTALFGPEVLVVFAHESGPILNSSFVSSLNIPVGKLSQSLPFTELIDTALNSNYACVDINVPSRAWRLKQTSLGDEAEAQELNSLMCLLWDRLVLRSGCKNVFFVASGAPIYAFGHLINNRKVDGQVRGAFFFSSTLFLPMIAAGSMADWYCKSSMIVVPSQEPARAAINNAVSSFGNCISAGMWTMSDSSAVVSDFKTDIFSFIRARILR